MVEDKDLKQIIITEYTDQILTVGSKPISVYKFCKKLKIDESEFYNHFGSFDNIESYFWETILHQTMEMVSEDLEEGDNGHHHLLSFYFTLFENFKLNRSFILFLTATKKQQLELDFSLRKILIPHLSIIAQKLHNPIHSISEDIGDKVANEALWFQFITLFHFWIKDSSAGFEKTDAFIEKSVRVGIDLTQNLPTESVLDFGKFILKEIKNIV